MRVWGLNPSQKLPANVLLSLLLALPGICEAQPQKFGEQIRSGLRRPARQRAEYKLPVSYRALSSVISINHYPDALSAEKRGYEPAGDMALVNNQDSRMNSRLTRGAVEKIKEGLNNAAGARREVRDDVAATDRLAEGVIDAADEGAFEEEVQRERIVRNPDGSSQIVLDTEQVDRSALPVIGAFALQTIVRANAPEIAQQRAIAAMEKGRIEAWNELLPKLPEIYPPAPSKGKLVGIEITPGGHDNEHPPGLAVTNQSGKTLTEVTLIVDLVHFTTAPEKTCREVFFIDEWKPNKTWYLPTEIYSNLPTTGRARPTWYSPDGKSLHKDKWLCGAGGAVEATLTLWSVELRQPEESVRLEVGAENAARWELDAAIAWAATDTERTKSNRSRRSANSARNRNNRRGRTVADREAARKNGDTADKKQADRKPPIDIIPSVRIAKRVATWVPADSEYGKIARMLLTEPAKAVEAWRQRESDILLTAVPEGARYVTDWIYYPPPPALKQGKRNQPNLLDLLANPQAMERPAPRQGKLMLEITASDPKSGRVTARAYDVETRKKQHTLLGKASYDPQSKKTTLKLDSRGLPRRKNPDSPVFPETAYTLMLTYDGENLIGTAEQAQLPNDVVQRGAPVKFVPERDAGL